MILPDRPEFAGYAAAALSLIAWLIAILKMPETQRPDVLSPPSQLVRRPRHGQSAPRRRRSACSC